MLPFLALLGLGLGGAGAAASYTGQKKSAEATSDVWRNLRQRNAQRQQEADAAFKSNLSKSGADTADAEIEQGAERRTAAYDKLDSASSPSRIPTQANKMVASPSAAPGAKGKAVKNAGSVWTKLLGTAQAKLGGRADWQLKQNVRDQRTTQNLNRITNFAQGDLNNVVPVELTAAAQKGDAYKGWGSLLSAAGTLAGTAGALGGGAPAGGTITERAATFKENPALAEGLTGGNIWKDIAGPNTTALQMGGFR